jgi:hypothetical protein
MKRAKKPTRAQKIIIKDNHLNPDNWMVIKETEFYIYLIGKDSNKRRTITKFPPKKEHKKSERRNSYK